MNLLICTTINISFINGFAMIRILSKIIIFFKQNIVDCLKITEDKLSNAKPILQMQG